MKKYSTFTKKYYIDIWDCFTYSGDIGNQKYNDYPDTMYSEDPGNINYSNEHLLINLSIDKFNSKTHNRTFPTEKEFEENYNKTPRLIMKYMFFDSTMNPKNFSHPIRKYSMESDISIFKKATLERRITFSIAEVRSDDGFIVENNNNQYFLEYDQFEDLPDSRVYFKFNMNFFLSKKYHIYSRTYLKIQGLLAEVSGIMGLVEYCVIFIYNYYSDTELSLTLINNSFNLKMKETIDETNKELAKINSIHSNTKKRSDLSDSSSRNDSVSISNDNVLDTPLQVSGIVY